MFRKNFDWLMLEAITEFLYTLFYPQIARIA